MSVGTRYTHKWIDKAIEDVGVQVPGIGEVFYIGQPGLRASAQYPLGTELPGARRTRCAHYDGLEFTFNRRLQNNWMLNVEPAAQPHVGQLLGPDQLGRERPQLAERQPLLRRPLHVVRSDGEAGRTAGCSRIGRGVLKMQPSYILPWGTMAGAEIDVESGLPQSSTVTFTGVPVFVFGRNDLGRSPTYSYVNLNFQQDVQAGQGHAGDGRAQHREPVRPDDGDDIGTAPYRDALTFPQCAGLTGTAGSIARTRRSSPGSTRRR